MKKLILCICVLAAVSVIFGCGETRAEKTSYGKAPDFSLTNIDNERFKLSDSSGKVIILNFFATWCPPCRKEMPDFNEIAAQYADKVKIIGINVGNEDIDRVREFVERNGLKFTIAIDEGKVTALYGPINAIPVTVIIDREFNIYKRYIGLRSKDTFLRDIEELL